MALQPEQLGPYKIGRRLGRGGMGTVYAGINLETGEAAAVKVLSASLAVEEGFRDRFEVEIETLKKLNHPNIVRLYGYGEHDSHLYYAMELIDGTNLEQELEAGRRFSWKEVTQFGIHLCRALKHAHDRGVVHRDIKPANLLLTTEHVIKLSDFGIARLFGNNRLTMEGGLIGTAEYMSPEQAEGKHVTYHCDLYSLGGVLYALLAGSPPFQSKSLPEMLQMQRFSEPTPLRKLVPQVPEELERIVARLLEKDPQKRVPNATILARQLAAMEHGLSAVARTASSSQVSTGRASSEFTLASPGQVTTAPPTYDPTAATRVVESPPEPRKLDGATDAYGLAPPSSPSKPAEAASDFELAPLPVNRFRTVEEDEEQTETKESPLLSVAAPVLLLVGCLALMAGGVWYFLQPPTADGMYASIQPKMEDGITDSSLDEDITSFLSRFPDDPRTGELRDYQGEISLKRTEKKFQIKGRHLIGDSTLPALQRDYLEAIKYEEIDPQRSADKLQALIELYGNSKNLPDGSAQAVELARLKLQKMNLSLKVSTLERLKLVDIKLEEARSLAESNPRGARTILENLIKLYGDRSWAAARMEKCRTLLAEIPLPVASDSSPSE